MDSSRGLQGHLWASLVLHAIIMDRTAAYPPCSSDGVEATYLTAVQHLASQCRLLWKVFQEQGCSRKVCPSLMSLVLPQTIVFQAQ